MFVRKEENYSIEDDDVRCVLLDESSPIRKIAEIVNNGSKVLDIGCGNGVLARVLKLKGKDVVIDGIEPNNYAAALSRSYYRNIHVGYAQDFYGLIEDEAYDYLILADVIEHIADPFDFLSNLLKNISGKTRVLVSIPNIAFGTFRLSILNGDFDYSDTGLLERTHLRFFTLKTVESLSSQLRIFIEKIFYLQRSLFKTEIHIEELKINPFAICFIPKDKTFFTYQFLLVLTKKQSEREDVMVGKMDKWLLLRYIFSKHKDSTFARMVRYTREIF